MTNYFELDRTITDAIDGFDQPDGVQLPFPVAYGFWLNGQGTRKPLQSAPYFGGWAFDYEKFDMVCGQTETSPPASFGAFTLTNREGDDFTVYATRWLGVAPIAKRYRWIDNRSHTQWLTMIATYDNEVKAYEPWGVAVLTGKGYAANFIGKAFAEFEAKTAAIRKSDAGNLPAKLFYAAVGTFGDKPVVTQVGKNSKSPITGATVHVPETITVDFLKTAYVGKEVANKMVDYGQQAAEWLAEWKKEKASNGQADTDNDADPGIPF